MKFHQTVACSLMVAVVLSTSQSHTQSTPQQEPQTVLVPSGKLQLKALLWKPASKGPFPAVIFSHGSGGADASQTAGMPVTEAAARLASVVARHGYAFFFICRRGQGLSADQGPFIRDLLKHEEAANGPEASRHLAFRLLNSDHLDDTMAALGTLKRLDGIDPHRIALVGHSFGGQLTLLAAERDPDVRAAVTFAAAAAVWENSAEVREELLGVADRISVPVMLVQAQNDFSTAPGRALDAELDRLHKTHLLKLYQPLATAMKMGTT